MNKYKFYDTSSLLLLTDKELEGEFIVSSITLSELEHIKTAHNKSPEVKYNARRVTRKLLTNMVYQVQIYSPDMENIINHYNLEINNDTKILASAIVWETVNAPDDMTFVTNDLCLYNLANLYFGTDSIEYVAPKYEEYCGYVEVSMSQDEMATFYSKQNENTYKLLPNQYLVIKEAESGDIVDRLCWTGSYYRHLNYQSFKSRWFGDVRPLHGDTYQMLAADTLANNQITMLKGPAGTGKTYLAMAYLLHKLDRNKIDKIIIFCNTIATKGAAKLGFYPGTRDEKLLDSQIGNLLSSKLGDKTEVERLIQEGKLVLLPLSDIRGYDTTGMRAGVYITEAQNMNIDLMKLTLQRIGEDSICIIDGDPLAQVDDESFAGDNNGMRRASQVFRGTDVYGEVELKNIHRSKIAAIAQEM